MFEKLEGVALRYEDISQELMSPDVASDQKHFRELMKEQSDLAPLVEAYQAYKKAGADAEEAQMILEEESDEDMRAPRRNCPLRVRNSPNWRNVSGSFFSPKILMMTRM